MNFGKATLGILALSFLPMFVVHGKTNYPDRSIQLIVPQDAGGPSDTLGRMLGQRLSEEVGQPVIIVNKPGAGGSIGSDFVAKAAPDGYTLLIHIVGTMAINDTLQPNLPFRFLEDFEPVGLVAASSLTFLAHPSVPVKTVGDVIEHAKNPENKMNVASSGTGSIMHLSIEMLNNEAGIALTHVPYKGAAPATTDLLGGHVQMAFVGTPAAIPLLKGGKVKALATTGLKRSALLSDVPTVAESGIAGFDVENVYGVWATRGTPDDRIELLSNALMKIANSDQFLGQLKELSFEPRSSAAQEHAAYNRSETEKWAAVINKNNITLD